MLIDGTLELVSTKNSGQLIELFNSLYINKEPILSRLVLRWHILTWFSISKMGRQDIFNLKSIILIKLTI